MSVHFKHMRERTFIFGQPCQCAPRENFLPAAPSVTVRVDRHRASRTGCAQLFSTPRFWNSGTLETLIYKIPIFIPLSIFFSYSLFLLYISTLSVPLFQKGVKV